MENIINELINNSRYQMIANKYKISLKSDIIESSKKDKKWINLELKIPKQDLIESNERAFIRIYNKNIKNIHELEWNGECHESNLINRILRFLVRNLKIHIKYKKANDLIKSVANEIITEINLKYNNTHIIMANEHFCSTSTITIDIYGYAFQIELKNPKYHFSENYPINQKNAEEQKEKIIKHITSIIDEKLKIIKNTNVTLITGGTGTGKTYYAINQMAQGNRFAYFSPTGALTMEAYAKYHQKGDSIKALGFNEDGEKNHFGIISGMGFLKEMNDFDTIIIDEFHWAFEFQNHGFWVNKILAEFKGKIIALTSTVNFHVPDAWQRVNLDAKASFQKTKVLHTEALERAKAGVPTLIICQYQKDLTEAQEWAKENLNESDYMSFSKGDVNPYTLLKAITDFNSGTIKCIISTNILAQGVNIACENLIIWDKNNKVIIHPCKGSSMCDCEGDYSCRYDKSFTGSASMADGELNTQRLGRLGRMNLTKEDSMLTWTVLPSSNNNNGEDISFDIEKKFSLLNLPNEMEENDYIPNQMSKYEIEGLHLLLAKKENGAIA